MKVFPYRLCTLGLSDFPLRFLKSISLTKEYSPFQTSESFDQPLFQQQLHGEDGRMYSIGQSQLADGPSRQQDVDLLQQSNHSFLEQAVQSHALRLLNSSIANKANENDLLTSKRFSLGLGGGSEHYSSHGFFDKGNMIDPNSSSMRSESFLRSPQKEVAFFDDGLMKKRRRLSALQINTDFFEDHAKTNLRRSSMNSIATFHSMASELNKRHDDEVDDDDSVISELDQPKEDEVLVEEEAPVGGPPSLNYAAEAPRPVYALPDVRGIMLAFTEAITCSTKSQQAIHDWDKKMGLKRSHSKTMRLTMRSRKKLKQMIKKDVNALLKF